MARRARFLLLLAFATLSSSGVFSQESAAKPEQATPESIRARTHCEVPLCVQKFLYFTNLSQPTELQDVVNAIRAIGDVQRVQQIIGDQLIIVEGTAEQVALAEKLATEIDRNKTKFEGLGYRMVFKIQESENDKVLHSRIYSFISDAHQAANVNIRRQLPAPPPVDSGSDNKQPPPAPDATIRNIDCHISGEHERTLELQVEAGFTGEAEHEPSGALGPLHRIRTRMTVQLDKPTVIGRIDDPESNHTFTIEVTATRIKEKS